MLRIFRYYSIVLCGVYSNRIRDWSMPISLLIVYFVLVVPMNGWAYTLSLSLSFSFLLLLVNALNAHSNDISPAMLFIMLWTHCHSPCFHSHFDFHLVGTVITLITMECCFCVHSKRIFYVGRSKHRNRNQLRCQIIGHGQKPFFHT